MIINRSILRTGLRSYMRAGLRSSVGGLLQALINAFKKRVLDDSGTIEAESCLKSTLANLLSIDLYPNGGSQVWDISEEIWDLSEQYFND